MAIDHDHYRVLDEFITKSKFLRRGAVITDLDGTAVHETNGQTIIHRDVEAGLKKVYESGRPVIINTLRFPLSVIRTFAKEWYSLSGASIPCVLLNGSQVGYIISEEDEFIFKQVSAFTLKEIEIQKIVTTLQRFGNVVNDIILFYYPEDWRKGELIWTPVPDKIESIKNKYRSAESVFSSGLEELTNRLLQEPICMILMLIDTSEDKLMAYQHTKKNNFFTTDSVDKLSGTEEIARLMNFDLEESVGAGDSAMDVFLSGTGLSVHVRNQYLPFRGKKSTIKLPDFHDFGDLLERLSQKQNEHVISR
jgi:hydroxymethylpyrimidine pyrophosphatase-like HAD family hydrolase